MLRKNVWVASVHMLRWGDLIKDDTGKVLIIRATHYRYKWYGVGYYEVTTNDVNWSLYLAENLPILVYKRQWE